MKYRVVAGNTGTGNILYSNFHSYHKLLWKRITVRQIFTGVYKNDGPYDAYVEVNSVPDLQVLSVNKSEAVIGGATTLSHAITFLQELSETEGFGYTAGMSKHIRRVANTPVRNVS